MEIKGKILAVSPLRSGVSMTGEWKNVDFAIEIAGTQYPESLVCRAKGDLAERIAALGQELVGAAVKAHVYFHARTYIGRDGQNHSSTEIICHELAADESND